MPFQPAANPDLAAEYMYRGITQLGAGIGQGLSEGLGGFLKAQQEKKKKRKLLEGLTMQMVNDNQISEEEAAFMSNMDTDSLEGYVDGKKVSAALKNLRQQQKFSQRQMEALEFKLAQDKQQAESQSKFLNLVGTRMAPRGVPFADAGQPRAPLQAPEIYSMAAEAGVPIGRDINEFAEAFERYGGTPTVVPSRVPGVAIFTDQSGRSHAMSHPVPRPAEAVAPPDEWIVTDDVDLFKQEILKVKDPAVRDAILDARRKYNLALGRTEDPVLAAIAQLLGGQKPSPAPTPQKPAPAPSLWNRFQERLKR